MADFLLPERTVTLELGDTDYAGAEIVVRTSIALAAYSRIDQILGNLTRSGGDGLEEAMAFFIAEGRPRWNLVDADGPVPATVEGMREHLEPAIIGGIVNAWVRQIGVVPPPLAGRSPAGSTSDARPARRRRRNSPKP